VVKFNIFTCLNSIGVTLELVKNYIIYHKLKPHLKINRFKIVSNITLTSRVIEFISILSHEAEI